MIAGAGKTIELSTAAVAFESAETMPQGAIVEAFISLPLYRDGMVRELGVYGEVCRSCGQRTIVKIRRYWYQNGDADTRRVDIPELTHISQ